MTDRIEPVVPASPVFLLRAIEEIQFPFEQSDRHRAPEKNIELGEGNPVRNVCIRRAPRLALMPRWGMICSGVQVHPSH